MKNLPKPEEGYAHTPLGDREIRLLQLTPQTIPNDLRFTIKSFVREQAPQYVALSYVWGSEDAIDLIHIDERKFYIRPNLRRFLSRVVHHIKLGFKDALATRTSTVTASQLDGALNWVDAICINQSIVAERNAQVRQIYKIYAGAVAVLA